MWTFLGDHPIAAVILVIASILPISELTAGIANIVRASRGSK